jgi:hypothetical protein
MSYYQKIKELIEDENDQALHVWVMAQPLAEQLAITQTIKDVLRDMLAADDSEEKKIMLQQMDNFTDAYNDAVLDEHIATVKYKKAVEERDKAMAEIEEATAGVRAYVIECITTNAPNAEAMKELAAKMIESEKEHGLFDPLNWKGVV